jgi:hypothetical protein
MNIIAPSESQPSSGNLRPADGTSFALVDGLPVMFSEDNQKLFELKGMSRVLLNF